jgi:hypothetical protein
MYDETIQEIVMKYFAYILPALLFALWGCDAQEASEHERTTVQFKDSLGGEISPLQWWETAVTIQVNIVTDKPLKLWLLSS